MSFAKDHIAIRPFRPEDAAPLLDATRDSIEELCSWMVWCHSDYSLEDSSNFIARSASEIDAGERYSFAIVHSEDGQVLGSVGLSSIDKVHRFANLGYWVRSNWTNRSVASNAAFLAARFAFHELGLHRLELIIPVGNLASQRVARKLGARREGILRKRLVLHSKPHDALMMSLVPEDMDRHDLRVDQPAPLPLYAET